MKPCKGGIRIGWRTDFGSLLRSSPGTPRQTQTNPRSSWRTKSTRILSPYLDEVACVTLRNDQQGSFLRMSEPVELRVRIFLRRKDRHWIQTSSVTFSGRL